MSDAAMESDGSVFEDNVASGDDSPPTKSTEQPKANSTAVEPPSKKRKRRFDAGDDRARRYRKIYSHGYRDVYNADVGDAVGFSFLEKSSHLTPSQIGASSWTTTEKQRLFSALERHGKGEIQKLTSAVGTKSESQVHEYLLLLQEGAVQIFLHDKKFDPKALRLFEIPAAHELSDECCNKLNEASTALSWYQYSFEARQEQEKHGEFWLLTPTIAAQIEEAYPKTVRKPKKKKRWDRYEAYETEEGSDRDVEEGEREDEEEEELNEDAKALLKSVPAASLLDLPKWIKLSQDVFMNAGGDRLDENWQSIAEGDDEIGIFHTAFSDFHRLAVSVTKRLVAAALSQATSRLRATDRNYEHAAKPSVSRRDVITALDMLSMPKSAKEVWQKIPEHCGVQVYSAVNRHHRPAEILDYDQVERMLGGIPLPMRPQQPLTEDGESISNFEGDPYREDGEESQDESKVRGEKNGGDGEDETEAAEVQEYEEKMDAYAEDHDMFQSQLEEAQMWKALGMPAPEFSQKGLKNPPRKPKLATDVDDVLDWRERVDHKAPWERYGHPITEAAYAKTQLSLIERPQGARQTRAQTTAVANKALENDVAPPEGDEVEF